MKHITQQALKERARDLLVAMTQRSRWVYALPPGSFRKATAILQKARLERSATEADGTVVKFLSDTASFVVFDAAALGVVLLEGEGDAVAPLKEILDETGFVPQSKLLADALDIGEAHALTGLRILAHMAIGWDEDWTDLFLLHLASPDPIVRHEATLSLTMAAMVGGDASPAVMLLEEAHQRESYPQLADTMADALRVLRAFRGDPVDIADVENRTLE